jgi:NAD(P)-dependent dehydrogenase (short-subunit alcohol dehydrogenase family)
VSHSVSGYQPLKLPLAGKIVVVTGGAGLLGRAFTSGITERGGTAIVADIDVARATEVAGAIASNAVGAAIPMAVDITDEASVNSLIAACVSRCGRVDAVVNNAYPRNKAYGRTLEAVTYADFCENVGLHAGGYFLVAQRFAKHFAATGGGNIVNMASIYGSLPPRFGVYDGTAMTMPVEYAVIKAGIIQLTRYLAQFYKGQGIRVNTLSPGGILDNQPESFLARYGAMAGSKGMLAPEDLVGALAFLLSDDSRYVTGQNLVVDDGFSL